MVTNPLPSRAYARSTDPGTSHLAAETVNVARHARIVLTVLSRSSLDAMTDPEIYMEAVKIGRSEYKLPHVTEQSIRSRRHELQAKGWIEPVGKVKGGTGRMYTLWRLTPAGVRVCEELNLDTTHNPYSGLRCK